MGSSVTRSGRFEDDREWIAREEGKARHKSYQFWYRKTYNLTSTDPRYLDATLDEMMADYFAHRFFDDPKAAEEVVDDDFDPDDVARQIGAVDLPDDFEDMT